MWALFPMSQPPAGRVACCKSPSTYETVVDAIGVQEEPYSPDGVGWAWGSRRAFWRR